MKLLSVLLVGSTIASGSAFASDYNTQLDEIRRAAAARAQAAAEEAARAQAAAEEAARAQAAAEEAARAQAAAEEAARAQAAATQAAAEDQVRPPVPYAWDTLIGTDGRDGREAIDRADGTDEATDRAYALSVQEQLFNADDRNSSEIYDRLCNLAREMANDSGDPYELVLNQLINSM